MSDISAIHVCGGLIEKKDHTKYLWYDPESEAA